MSKFATRLLPEVQAILEHNEIDWKRCTEVSVKHTVDGVATHITVTMLALAPDGEAKA